MREPISRLDEPLVTALVRGRDTAIVGFAVPLGGQWWAHRGFLEADDGDRTRDPQLGKLMLYQLSYVRDARRIAKSGTIGSTRDGLW